MNFLPYLEALTTKETYLLKNTCISGTKNLNKYWKIWFCKTNIYHMMLES